MITIIFEQYRTHLFWLNVDLTYRIFHTGSCRSRKNYFVSCLAFCISYQIWHTRQCRVGKNDVCFSFSFFKTMPKKKKTNKQNKTKQISKQKTNKQNKTKWNKNKQRKKKTNAKNNNNNNNKPQQPVHHTNKSMSEAFNWLYLPLLCIGSWILKIQIHISNV